MAVEPIQFHPQSTVQRYTPPQAYSRDPASSPRKFRRRTRQALHPSGLEDAEHGLTMSSSSDHEMDAWDSDEEYHHQDTSLPTEERRKFLHNKRQNRGRLLDPTDAVIYPTTKAEQQAADRHVARRLLINGLLIVGWYFFSLSISLYNKWMFSPQKLNFHFPMFTTSLHMVVQFMLASLVLLIFPSLRPSTSRPPRDPHNLSPDPTAADQYADKPLITPLFYLTRLLPCGATTSLDIGLGNASLQFITLTFYTMCKSSVLIWVLVCAFLFRLESPSVKLIAIILSMTLGVVMMVFGETAFQATGFALAITASAFSGFRWALTQILLLRHPATSNPFATLFFLAPIMFVTLFVIAIFSERPSQVIIGLQLLVADQGLARSIALMFIPGCLAFCMIASEFTLLQRTNVVTLSICGIFKEVVTIAAAGVVFHDTLSVINVVGLLVTIVAIACYNYMKITKMRREAHEKLSKKHDEQRGIVGVPYRESDPE